ncbi:unnamed protein product, partial [Gulo gulo]
GGCGLTVSARKKSPTRALLRLTVCTCTANTGTTVPVTAGSSAPSQSHPAPATLGQAPATSCELPKGQRGSAHSCCPVTCEGPATGGRKVHGGLRLTPSVKHSASRTHCKDSARVGHYGYFHHHYCRPDHLTISC